MPKHKGSWAEKLMEEHWKSKGKRVFVHRFTDASDVRGLNKGSKVGMYPQPADYLVVDTGNTFFAEVKATENLTRFSLSKIRPVQLAAAKRVVTAGGQYYFFVCIVSRAIYRIPASFILGYTGSSIEFSSIPNYKYEGVSSVS